MNKRVRKDAHTFRPVDWSRLQVGLAKFPRGYSVADLQARAYGFLAGQPTIRVSQKQDPNRWTLYKFEKRDKSQPFARVIRMLRARILAIEAEDPNNCRLEEYREAVLVLQNAPCYSRRKSRKQSRQ